MAALVVACSSTDTSEQASDDGEAVAVSAEAIIGGTPAAAYPEAALLDIDRPANGGSYYVCSATLIAPRVVLTAGHCVDAHKTWTVYVGNQSRTSAQGVTYDWAERGATSVNPAHHDLGLVFLDSPIMLASYPKLSAAALPSGSKVLDIGRILHGTVTTSSYQASAVVTDGARIGYPFDYASPVVIEPGDSGGAVMADGTHTLVAVNSGAGGTTQVLARVDLLLSWINAQVAAHPVASADAGAPAPSSSADAGAPKPAPTTSASADAGVPVPSCQAEREPNNDVSTANAITGSSFCGALSSTDVDWTTLTIPAGSTSLQLTATGDAVFSIGQLSTGRCLPLGSALKAVRVTATGGSFSACVSIASPGKLAQSYSFFATRS